eukprot:1174336-Prorocentrum_minimum.AAC.1
MFSAVDDGAEHLPKIAVGLHAIDAIGDDPFLASARYAPPRSQALSAAHLPLPLVGHPSLVPGSPCGVGFGNSLL